MFINYIDLFSFSFFFFFLRLLLAGFLFALCLLAAAPLQKPRIRGLFCQLGISGSSSFSQPSSLFLSALSSSFMDPLELLALVSAFFPPLPASFGSSLRFSAALLPFFFSAFLLFFSLSFLGFCLAGSFAFPGWALAFFLLFPSFFSRKIRLSFSC